LVGKIPWLKPYLWRIFHAETVKHVIPQSEGRRRVALYIRDLHRNQWRKWRLGEPLPEDISEIAIFKADGVELRLILDAMQANVTNKPVSVNRALTKLSD